MCRDTGPASGILSPVLEYPMKNAKCVAMRIRFPLLTGFEVPLPVF